MVPLLARVEQALQEGLGLLALHHGDAAARGRQRVARRLHRARHQVPHRVHQRAPRHRVGVCGVEVGDVGSIKVYFIQ